MCDLAVGESSDIRDLSVLQGSRRFAAGRSLSIFLVGREVEGDEEEEVRAEYTHAGESREFLAGAFARVWHPWEVGRCEISV